MRVIYSSNHRFATGDTVSFSPGAFEDAASRGKYTVLLCLPDDGIGFQYRIRSLSDLHERTVREQRLRPAAGGTTPPGSPR